ncbi:MAG: hypothetical protein J6Y85_05655 [Alphaproteobacteria bacterium]|nr:hypothetical protein [Alphaproteobacteria bacterium]
MKQKIFYYHFKKNDACLWAMIIAFVLLSLTDFTSVLMWILFIGTVLIWAYKHLMPLPAVIITEKTIKVDHNNPVAWKDIKAAKVLSVRMCGKDYRILSLIPKKDIKYRYNWLQKHNCIFGPFPIALYGILTPSDEKEIVQLVKAKIK